MKEVRYLDALHFSSLSDVVNKGSYGTPYGGDVIFAVPALSEKGYLDVRVEVTTKGGHSSVPPKHTVRVHTSTVDSISLNPA